MRPLALSVLIGWCGADRPLLKREGLEPMALMTAITALGVFFLWKGGGYFTMGAALFFSAGAYVLRGWAFSVEWSLEETLSSWRALARKGVPAREILERGPAAGFYQGRPIPAWIRTSDRAVWDFHDIAAGPAREDRAAADPAEETAEEYFLDGELVYRQRGAGAKADGPDSPAPGGNPKRRNTALCASRARRLLETRRRGQGSRLPSMCRRSCRG